MTNYEMMVILSPDLGEKKTSEELDQIRTMITSTGGEILNEDLHGIRPFAYRIKKYDEGYYAVLNFNIEGEKVKEFEQEYNINQAIVRYLITKTPKHYSFKTLSEYDADAEKAAKDKEAEAASKKEESSMPPARKPAPKPVAKAVVKKEEKPAKEEPKEEPKEKLEKVDEKLKSIIDDPDITL